MVGALHPLRHQWSKKQGRSTIKDEHARKRAEARSSTAKKKGRARGRPRKADAVVLPRHEEEMGKFKGICRHILKHETKPEQAEWFKMEPRMNLKRLAKLGVEGNQPAIAASSI